MEKTTRNVRADHTMAKEALQYWVDSGRQPISTSTRTPTSSYVVVPHGQFLFLEKQSHRRSGVRYSIRISMDTTTPETLVQTDVLTHRT